MQMTHTCQHQFFFAANSGKTKVFSIQNDDDDDDGLVITLIFAKQKNSFISKKNHQLEHCREIIIIIIRITKEKNHTEPIDISM